MKYKFWHGGEKFQAESYEDQERFCKGQETEKEVIKLISKPELEEVDKFKKNLIDQDELIEKVAERVAAKMLQLNNKKSNGKK